MNRLCLLTLPISFLLYSQTFAQNFTEVSATPFTGVARSAIAFADVDGDNDLDVLITGITLVQQGTPGDRISKLYLNDGAGSYTEVSGAPFVGVDDGSISFADVDGDNDQDVLITGNSDLGLSAKLYTNDGLGNFSEVIGAPFVGVDGSSIAFADVDGDNDPDVLITGNEGSSPAYVASSRLYINDGSGSFTEMMNTSFDGVRDASIAFADVDGDNDQDVLVTGNTDLNGLISKLYTNDGAGGFSEVTGTPFTGVAFGAIAFADVDGDNDQDVLISGNEGVAGLSKLYTNDGSGHFTEVMGTSFPGLQGSAVAFTDVDDDNDQDVLITGGMGLFSVEYTGLYTNDGSGNFTEVTSKPISDVGSGSISFTDVDGDTDMDVLVTGQAPSGYIAKLYTNDIGALSLSEVLFSDPVANLNITPYPNPTISDNLNIRFNSTKSKRINIQVYDFKGRMVRQQQEFAGTGEQTFSVDITSLPSGNYLIQLDDGSNSGAAKFMIQ
ncbi:MAG: T9SS type A sorting domain-containing protein [Bacteroidota bacterium]